MIVGCLDVVKQYGLNSVAFPTIGCGGFKFPADKVAHCFKEAIEETGYSIKVLNLILLPRIIFNNDNYNLRVANKL